MRAAIPQILSIANISKPAHHIIFLFVVSSTNATLIIYVFIKFLYWGVAGPASTYKGIATKKV